MPDSTHEQYGDWGKIGDDLFGQIAKRLDITSTVRLAACSMDFLCQIAALRHWYVPCLLMPDAYRWHYNVDRMHDTVHDVVPLDHPPRTAILPFMANRFWVGMNGDWIALVDQSGNWFLTNLYTHQQIPLPSASTCNIRRSVKDTENRTFVHPESYALGCSSLNLLKIIIYEVPT